jgi:putative endonuclease
MRIITAGPGRARGQPVRMQAWLQSLFHRRETPSAAGRGAAGEQLAADYLRRRRGFAIVARNWRNPRERREEIDLVCRDREVLVFVEVKSRKDTARVRGFAAVDRRKKRVLRRAIRAYLTQLSARPAVHRLDVVEVVTSARQPAQVRHFENVPLVGGSRHVLP